MDLPSPADQVFALAPAQAPRPGRTDDPAKARKVAEDFAAFFLSQFMDETFAGVGPDALFGGGEGEQVFRSMMFQEYGKAMAQRGGFGITDVVQKEILKLQEVG